MKMKPIAIAAISGLVVALAGMPVMADDSSTDQSVQQSDSSSTDKSQSTDSSQGNTNSSDTSNDEGSADTPSGDDY